MKVTENFILKWIPIQNEHQITWPVLGITVLDQFSENFQMKKKTSRWMKNHKNRMKLLSFVYLGLKIHATKIKEWICNESCILRWCKGAKKYKRVEIGEQQFFKGIVGT